MRPKGHASFLSLSWRSWSLSLGLHLLAGTTLLFLGRAKALDLTLVNLDLAPSLSLAPTNPAEQDETWRNPGSTPHPKPVPVQLPPKPAPPAAASSTVPAAATGGEGKEAGFRSIAQVSQLPHFNVQVKADYPEAAKRANIEGTVILQVDIDATGTVKKVEVVQGLGYGCDEAAVEAMQKSNFTPALGALGEPVPVQHVRIPYRFKIED